MPFLFLPLGFQLPESWASSLQNCEMRKFGRSITQFVALRDSSPCKPTRTAHPSLPVIYDVFVPTSKSGSEGPIRVAKKNQVSASTVTDNSATSATEK